MANDDFGKVGHGMTFDPADPEVFTPEAETKPESSPQYSGPAPVDSKNEA